MAWPDDAHGWAGLMLRGGLLLSALVHLVPAAAVRSPEAVVALYGVPADRADIIVLMRHRALLFGVLALVLAAGALVPALRVPAAALGLLSMVGFAWLVAAADAPPAALVTIQRVDLLLSAWLLVALGLLGWARAVR